MNLPIEPDEIEVRVERRPRIKLTLPAATYDDAWQAKFHCASCQREIPIVGHRNFVVDPETRLPQMKGSPSDVCYGCHRKLGGLLRLESWGDAKNCSDRDRRTLSAALGLVGALVAEAGHAR